MQEHKGNIIDVHLNILIENKFKFVTNSLYNNTISVASLTLLDLKKIALIFSLKYKFIWYYVSTCS